MGHTSVLAHLRGCRVSPSGLCGMALSLVVSACLVATGAEQTTIEVQAERGTGDGELRMRSQASRQRTVWLHDGEALQMPVRVAAAGRFSVTLRYSNDNLNNGRLETVTVRVGDVEVGQVRPEDTGDGGHGWNVFRWTAEIGQVQLTAGAHTLTVSVSGGDGYGVEIDVVRLEPVGP